MQGVAETKRQDTTATVTDRAVLRPLRLNFAQVCYVCGTRWCDSFRCVAYHVASTWMVCDACDGFGWDADALAPCGCYGGLTEIDADDAETLGNRPLPVTAQDTHSHVTPGAQVLAERPMWLDHQ